MGKTESAEPTEGQEKSKKNSSKKIPRNSIKLQFAGELVLARCPDRSLSGPFRRYQALLEAFANMSREERLINYKMVNALMLTSHAKKTPNADDRKELFELKNQLFYDVANSEARKRVALRYLASSTFRVVEYCESCQKKNSESELPRHQWRFCNKCTIDRSFYNVLCMFRKFEGGHVSIFLSNDRIDQIQGFRPQVKGKRESFNEEAQYQKFQYNIKNLDSIELDSVLKMHKKLLGKS